MRKLVLLVTLFTTTVAFSQEICDNGLDDDGDGFIDCFDKDCADHPDCVDSYISSLPDCEVPPDIFPNFDLELDYVTENLSTSGNGFFNIGDVDTDGIPDIISVNYYDNSITVTDGRTGLRKSRTKLGSKRPYLEVATADIDGDGCAEIFVPVRNGGSYEIQAWNCDLTVNLWTTGTKSRPGNIGIADFDEDGLVEVFAKDEIFDAHSGTKMFTSPLSNNYKNSQYSDKILNAGSVAVDVLDDAECADCSGLELVNGGRIYTVDINRGALTADVVVERSVDIEPVYISAWRQNRSGTSVADYNLDGFLDIISNGRTSSDNDTQVFFWDVQNNTVSIYKDTDDNWDKGTGRLNIADIDGDGLMNVSYVSGPYLYALDENWDLFWKKPIVEGSSGTTGTTVFDFNGDGKWETVYRDEANLYIIDGVTGDFFSSIPCRSLTFMEYPIVADVDNDGETEICVACMTNDGGDIWKNMRDSQIRVFKSKDDEWVAARKIWNQHAYFNANVNDDLTIPVEMQKHHLVWSTGTCKSGPVRPLNNFLNQAPFLTLEGCPDYGSVDLAWAANVDVTMPQCPDTDIIISFDVANLGDKPVDQDIPITFYNGDPFTAAAIRLNVTSTRLIDPEDDTVRVFNQVVLGPGTAFDLYVSINDNGSDTPPIAFPIGGVPECEYGNNVGMIPITPLPFPVFVENVKDNEKCATSVFDNGEARAWVEEGGVEVTTGYTFNWWLGAAAGPPIYQGPNYTGLPAGTYFVSATHDLKMCSSDTAMVVINETGAIAPTINITVDSDFSDCQNPDGQMTADVNGGDDPANYDFVWIDGVNIGIADTISISHIASGLLAKTYTVVVTDKLTGCQSILPGTVPQSANFPVVNAVVDNDLTICNVVTPDGSATADVGGVQVGFTFNWYDGPSVNPTADFVGATYTGLGAGMYTVTATNDATGCISDPFTVTISDNTSNPVVNITVDSEQTSCNVPNGAVSADVGGSTAGFTFSWFQGQTTDPSFELASSPSPSITGLAAGIYTVEAVDTGSGCTATAEVTIVDDFPTITVTPSVVNQTDCANPNGEMTATSSGGATPHTYLWYDGIVGSPDINNPDYGGQTVTNLLAGDYTLVVLDANNCASATANVTIVDDTVNPVITTSLSDQTSCDGLNPNGGIDANVGGNTVDFTFNIYSGQNTNPVNEVTGSPAASVTGLAAGIYTVLATDNNTGCFASVEVTVVDDIPTITGTPTATPQTDCGSPDGELTATASGGAGPYTFLWYDGFVGAPDVNNPDYTGQTISNLVAGNYTLVVQDATGCTSAPVNAAVTDATVSPVISSSLTDQTSCDALNPNGGIDANVGGNTVDYTFNIFAGQNTNPGNEVAGSPSASVTGLAAGIYTILATDNTTGCFSTEEVTVVDNLPTITGTPTATDQADCAAPDGELTATAVGGATPYTFLWYNGTVGSPDVNNPDFTGQTISNLTAGDYTLLVVDDNTCESAPVNVTINDISVSPTITSSLTDQTSCDVLNPNGTISANVGGNTVDYTFNIYAGQNTNPVNEVAGSPSPNVTGLAAGIYTILATDINTGCFATEEVTVVDNFPVIVGTPTATDQVDCAAPDGELTATAAGGAGPYTFLWYNGTVGAPDVNNPDFTGQTIANLTAGDFTLLVVDANTCTSAPVNVTVNDNSIAPVISATTTDQTSCDALTPNGSISANVGGNTVDYTFNIFAGQNTNPVNEVTGSPAATVTGLASGIYTILATDNATGCFDQVEITVSDNFPTIIGTPTSTDQTNCGAPDGEITATAVGGQAPYTFLWYDGVVGAPDVNNPDYTGQTISNLVAGDYTLVVVDDNSCTSAPANVTINDSSTTPVISTTLVDQSSCNPLTPNGEISANVGGNTVDYTFNIFAGQNTAPANEVVGSPSATVTGLTAGIYTVLATDNNTGCFATVEVTVVESLPTIVATPSSVDQTDCGAPDGQLTAAGAGGAGPYTFVWFDGIVAAPDVNNPDYTGQTINNLSAGDYTLVAIDANSCESSPANITLTDATVLPVVTSVSTDQTACDPALPNGTISSNVGGNTTDYTFRVFVGQNTLPANEVAGSPGAVVSNLAQGLYTVQAVHNVTGCEGTVEVTVNNNVTLPSITAVPTDITNCTPTNGTITVTPSIGNPADYTFSYYDGGTTKAVPDYAETTNVITGLSEGSYTITAFNNVLGCNVDMPITVQIGQDPSSVITITELGAERIVPSDCASNSGALGATASSPSNTSGFDFEWYSGSGAQGMAFISNGTDLDAPPTQNRLTSLISGQYSVIAIDRDTGCQDTLSIFLPFQDQHDITLTATPVNNTHCTIPNGSVDIDANIPVATQILVPGINPSFYRFDVYEGGVFIKSVAGNVTNPTTIPNLAEGNYEIVAVENNVALPNNCSSPAVAVEILLDAPPITVVGAITENKSCGGATSGEIALTVDGVPTPAAGYTYVWHDGDKTSDPVLPAGQTPAPGHTAINLDAGFYTVEVTSVATGCTEVASFSILNESHVISLNSADIVTTDQTNCAPVNGTASVTDIVVDGVALGSVANYTFDWYESDGVTPVAGAGNAATIAVGLAAGTYYVDATSTAGTTLNCSSGLTEFEIVETISDPVITASTSNVNVNCAGATPNGSVTIEIDGGASPVSEYTVEWFEGSTTVTPLGTNFGVVAGADDETADQLPAGTVTVRVTDNTGVNLACFDTKTFTIGEDLPLLTIAQADLTVVENTSCAAAFTGSATVAQVLEDGVPFAVGGYSFDWLESDGVTAVAGAGNGPTPAVGLAGGDYFVVANNTGSSCATSMVAFTVDDNTSDPLVVATVNNANVNCAGGTPTGTVTIDIDGGGNPADYTIEWFEGNTPVIPLGTNYGVDGGVTASQLIAGPVTVRVTKNGAPNNLCVSVSTFTVLDDQPIVTIAAADLNVTPNDACSAPFNGSATVAQIREDGTPFAIGGYTFAWFESDGVTPIAGAGNAATIAVALAPGFYTVQATNTTSTCATTAVQFEIEDNSVLPVLTASVLNANVNCVGATPTGEVTLEIDGGASLANYTIEWFEGSTTVTALGTNFGAVAGGNGESATQLPAGAVTVRVTDNLSPNLNCQSVTTFNVLDDQPALTIASADLSVTPNDACAAPFNGSATVAQVMEDGVGFPVGGYTFEWLESDGATAVLGAGNGPTPTVGLSPADYFVRATSTTSTCVTSTVQFTIDDNSTPPVVTASVFNANVNCVGATPTGEVTIEIDGGVSLANYTIEWFEGNGVVVPLGTNFGTQGGGNNETASDLPAGIVTARVTDNLNPNLNCQTIATFNVLDDQPVLSIATADLTVTPNDACAAPFNGSATVAQVLEDGVAFPIGGYTFDWFESDGVTPVVGAGNGATVGTGLAPNDYFVQATSTTSTCVSTMIQFTIEDNSTLPVVTASIFNANVNCVGSTPTGQVTIEIDGGVALGDYTIEWFEGNTVGTALGTNFGAVAGADNETASDLPAGFVTVRVTDNVNPNSNCQTITIFEVLDDQPAVTIATADLTVTPNDACAAPFNGSATVAQVSEDGVGFPVGGYTFEWFEADGVTLVVGAGNGPTVGVGLSPNDYNIRATSTTSSCVTTMVQFTIEDNSENPVVTSTVLDPNINCTGATPTGIVTIEVNGGDPLADYMIEWFEGNGTVIPLGTNFGTVAGANNESATELPAGFITVRVTDTASPNLNCATISTFEILDAQPTLTIANADIVITNNTNCAAPFNGNVEVLSVQEDGIAMPVANYTFEWYESDGTTLVAGAGGGPIPAIGLNSGIYYIRAINNTSQCVNFPPIEFEIGDDTVLPEINLIDFNNPITCDGVNPPGVLRVTANNSSSTVDYTFEWYTGNDPNTGILIEPNNSFVGGLTAGDYTVVVTDNSSGCQQQETYTMVNEVNQLTITLSSTPVTNCVNPNGTVFAAVTNSSATFDYEWYIGTTVTGTPDFVGQTISNLSAGTYTVVAVDQGDPTCTTTEMSVDVIETLDIPVPEIVIDSDLTHCDPTVPNGQLTASVGGSFTGYTFEWFEGVDDSTPVIYTGPTVTMLTNTTYTVRATDVISGCSALISETIEFVPDVTPLPTIVLESDVTQCDFPNGELSVSVDGRLNYDFNWYASANAQGAVISTDINLFDLDAGTYSVTATDPLTGCVSDPVNMDVLDVTNIPEFDFVVLPSSCEEPTGSVQIVPAPGSLIINAIWERDGVITEAPQLLDHAAGTYNVTVIGEGNCEATGQVIIDADIFVYNGLSPNGDNLNEFFRVECIELFENNNVRIYNRAGQIIYNADHYDNADTSFKGIGNRGLYLSGNELPDGTYFYIIDKGDGSPLYRGYLELSR